MEHNTFLELTIREAREGMRARKGGPFGSVIARDGKILGKGHNTVLATHDPTAHAEINAIRDACKATGHHHLTGAVLYTNFEPCPMCLAAIYWADIRTIYYCADRYAAEEAGFMDKYLYKEISLPSPSREIRTHVIRLEEMDRLLDEWDQLEDKIHY